MADFKKGDKVEWDSSGGVALGEIIEKLTEETQIKGHTAKASKEEPQYRVRTESGKEAIHKPEELRKKSD